MGGKSKGGMIAALLLFSVLLSAAEADPFSEGYRLYKEDRTAEAAELWQKSASQDDARAMVFLAVLFSRGDSVSWDYMRSNIWLETAFAKLDERSRARILEQLFDEWIVSDDLDLGWVVASAYRRGLVDVVFLPPFEDIETKNFIQEAIDKLPSSGVSYQKELYIRWVAYLASRGHLQSRFEWIKAQEKLNIEHGGAEELIDMMLAGHLPAGKLAYQLYYNSEDVREQVSACTAKLVVDSYAVKQRTIRGCEDETIADAAHKLFDIYTDLIAGAKRIYINSVPTDVLINSASGA